MLVAAIAAFTVMYQPLHESRGLAEVARAVRESQERGLLEPRVSAATECAAGPSKRQEEKGVPLTDVLRRRKRAQVVDGQRPAQPAPLDTPGAPHNVEAMRVPDLPGPDVLGTFPSTVMEEYTSRAGALGETCVQALSKLLVHR